MSFDDRKEFKCPGCGKEWVVLGKGESLAKNKTLRQWYKGMALSLGAGVWPGGEMPQNSSQIAENCRDIADAMLAEDAEFSRRTK